MKCKINAKHAMLPVGGTVTDANGDKIAEGTAPNGKGMCPECRTPDRKLTGKGFVGAHNVVLDVDATIPVTDEGLRVGSPRESAIKRELEGRKISAGVADMPHADMSDLAGANRGPALTRGRPEAPRLRDPELSWDEPTDRRPNGQPRKMTSLEQSLGREGFDRSVIGPAGQLVFNDGQRAEVVSNRGANGGSRRTNKRNARRARQRQTMRALAIGKGK